MSELVDKTEIVCLIFARGGSKGLPDKNIRPLLGKPLIQWTIETAFKVPEISRVIVSTDSSQIAEIAVSCGAEVPFVRPEYLSSDTAAELDAWKHALAYLRDEELSMPEIMVSLPATAPLRSVADVSQAIQLFFSTDSDLVVAVSEAQRNPYFNMLTKENDLFKLGNSSHKVSRRQDAPEFFDLSTVVYVARTNFVIAADRILDGKTRAIVIPKNRALDIDDLSDFQYAEFLLGKVEEDR
jgi:N-acylneuraminate cytidylyltransferase